MVLPLFFPDAVVLFHGGIFERWTANNICERRLVMHTLSHLQEALHQKEQALLQYVRYMREAQDSQNEEIAALYADLAKAEEKHIAVIRDQVVQHSNGMEALNKYQQVNQYSSQHSTYQYSPEQ
jgi:rubrerythrin